MKPLDADPITTAARVALEKIEKRRQKRALAPPGQEVTEFVPAKTCVVQREAFFLLANGNWYHPRFCRKGRVARFVMPLGRPRYEGDSITCPNTALHLSTVLAGLLALHVIAPEDVQAVEAFNARVHRLSRAVSELEGAVERVKAAGYKVTGKPKLPLAREEED